MTNSEVKKKMLTKGRVEEICRATGSSEAEVKSVLTSALPLLLGASGSSSNANSGLGMLTGLLASQNSQPAQQSGGLTLIQDEPQNNGGAGLNLLAGLLGGGNQNQGNIAGSLLSGLLGASGTNQAAAEEQVSQQTGVGKNKVSLIMLAAIPLLLKMLKDDSSSSSTGTGKKKKKKPASGSSSAQSSGSISDLLLSLLK